MKIEVIKKRMDEIADLETHLKQISRMFEVNFSGTAVGFTARDKFLPCSSANLIRQYKDNLSSHIDALKRSLENDTSVHANEESSTNNLPDVL